MRNYKRIFAILNAIGMTKEEAVLEFTDGRTDSMSALSDAEFNLLLSQLTILQDVPKDWKPKPGDAMRKKMMGIARDMRWGVTSQPVIAKINDFLLTRTKFKKPLDQLTPDELQEACTILENYVKTSFYKGLNR